MSADSRLISRHYLTDEADIVNELARQADVGKATRENIQQTAATLVEAVRRHAAKEGGLDAFLQQYDLSSEEGVLLMCIAEALLRIPDADTADRLIADKITAANWQDHLGESDSLFVNASTWGLMLTGQLLKPSEDVRRNPARYLGKIASRTGEPVVRTAMRQAMRIMGHQFVMGRNIEEAVKRSARKGNLKFRYSYDMLGEAALTAADAKRYFAAYADAIAVIGNSGNADDDIFSRPGISVKLSALHPRYEYRKRERVLNDLTPRLQHLVHLAADANIGITIDAEEADRLELSLDVFAATYRKLTPAGFAGFGLAVQAYQRRSTDVLRFLTALAAEGGRRIAVRLVKGAYWDTEVKRSQEQGLSSYPVFTRKAHTDVSYLACARLLLGAGEHLYGQFATHNAHTLASVLHFAGSRQDFEFQRLHGMGEELYDEVVDADKFARPCRVYAPVGSHEDLLPYLVRRLLENGANTSFVNRILDENIPLHDIVADPVNVTRVTEGRPHSSIPAPADIFGAERRNSNGFNLADRKVEQDLLAAIRKNSQGGYCAAPIVGGKRMAGEETQSVNPANTDVIVGTCELATPEIVDAAIRLAASAQPAWDATPVERRVEILEHAADLFTTHAAELIGLCVAEAGKTVPDAVAEVREAIDFIRYYAAQARLVLNREVELGGPTGERNTLAFRGRGIFVCVSPWNFPLAIFTGQVAAALVSGNAALAKPAEQTPLIGSRAIELLLEAGIPGDVLHFIPGDGATIGAYAVSRNAVAGVAFTGSTDTANLINRALANRDGPIAVLIAETGGLNAMFADSSALPEQVVTDSIYSAFNSAGQRCSALRILCVQEDIADRVIELMLGQMRELTIGDPADITTDIGPVIDVEAKVALNKHIAAMTRDATLLYSCALPGETSCGTYVAPTAVEIDRIDVLKREVFGPVMHVFRYRAKALKETVDAVNATGFGLTMGLHTRIDSRARAFAKLSGAGNVYINRNMIGAVVGVQPFGGRGMSGTGPKAGGPNYLQRFCTEVTVSNNISAVGGNASLLSLDTE